MASKRHARKAIQKNKNAIDAKKKFDTHPSDTQKLPQTIQPPVATEEVPEHTQALAKKRKTTRKGQDGSRTYDTKKQPNTTVSTKQQNRKQMNKSSKAPVRYWNKFATVKPSSTNDGGTDLSAQMAIPTRNETEQPKVPKALPLRTSVAEVKIESKSQKRNSISMKPNKGKDRPQQIGQHEISPSSNKSSKTTPFSEPSIPNSWNTPLSSRSWYSTAVYFQSLEGGQTDALWNPDNCTSSIATTGDKKISLKDPKDSSSELKQPNPDPSSDRGRNQRIKKKKAKVSTKSKSERQSMLEVQSNQSKGDQTGEETSQTLQSATFLANDPADYNYGWPWIGAPTKLITQAPFAPSEYNEDKGYFKKAEHKQTSRLISLPKDLKFMILENICMHHTSMAAFSSTCQTAFFDVSGYVTHWDIARLRFNGCQMNSEQWKSNDQRMEIEQKKALEAGGSFEEDEWVDPKARSQKVGSVTVVAPFRHRSRYYDHIPFSLAYVGAGHFFNACYLHASRFKVLHLHHVSMITTEALELIIPLMSNLRMLGVYRCPLIHIGDTLPLLRIVKLGRQVSAQLDFSPRYHTGPDPEHSHGEFGVTWDDPEGDSRLGVWSIVYKAIPIAKAQGIDLLSRFSAFRQWIEKTPCSNIEKTIDAMGRIWARAAHRKSTSRSSKKKSKSDDLTTVYSSMIFEDAQLRITCGQRGVFKPPTSPLSLDRMSTSLEDIDQLVRDLVWQVDWAESYGHTDIKRNWDGKDGIFETFRCASCGWDLPGCLYRDVIWQRWRHFTKEKKIAYRQDFIFNCEGCNLHAVCNDETDHEKYAQRRLITKWLDDAHWPIPDELAKAVGQPELLEGLKNPAAKVFLDDKRRQQTLALAHKIDKRARDKVAEYVKARYERGEPLSKEEKKYYWRLLKQIHEPHRPLPPGRRYPVGPVLSRQKDKYESLW